MKPIVDREQLGRLVRSTWVVWAQEQLDAKPHWLTPWEELDEGQREVDRRIGEAVAEAVLDAPDGDLDQEDDDGEADSHVLGERRCRYVTPSWRIERSDEGEMELSKCARCARFFVQDAPIRLFLGQGEDTLGFEVCEACAPAVMARMGTGGG